MRRVKILKTSLKLLVIGERNSHGLGKDGLVVFDDVGYGKIQDQLRLEGYKVFGGSELGERLELDRSFGQKIFQQYGMTVVPLISFADSREAIEYVRLHPKKWVVKFNNQSSKSYTYVGYLEDGSDVVNLLQTYIINSEEINSAVTLQEQIEGVEVGVGRYFNGNDWVGPVEINFEHTRLFPGDIGPITSEMGTVAWFEEPENCRLYLETIDALKPFLQEANFRGDFEVNFIVNDSGIYPLEATTRFGSPIVHLHSEMLITPWAELLYALAAGENIDVKWKRGFGIVAMLATPPFPYAFGSREHSCYGTNIIIEETTEKNLQHIHFEEIGKNEHGQLYVSDSRGYVLFVTAQADSISTARRRVEKVLQSIHIPRSFYRNDIGVRVFKRDLPYLLERGLIKEPSPQNQFEVRVMINKQ
jgi:phosphoribosylamine--glycine ligase